MNRARRWCITLNNYTDEDVETWRNIQCKYICFGKEQGKQGTKHLQGYVEFENARNRNGLKTVFGSRCHFEAARGTAEQNIEYCSKESRDADGTIRPGLFFERGSHGLGAGKRTDLTSLKRKFLEEDVPLSELVESEVKNYQQLRFLEGLSRYKKPKHRQPKVFWYWGATGAGKTKTAYEHCDMNDCWISNGGLQWFDGYTGQRFVILDDLRLESKDFAFLLRLLDVYPFRVPFKGGFTNWQAEYIYVTCPYPPDAMPGCAHENIAQLTRRISEVREFKMDDPKELDTQDIEALMFQSENEEEDLTEIESD